MIPQSSDEFLLKIPKHKNTNLVVLHRKVLEVSKEVYWSHGLRAQRAQKMKSRRPLEVRARRRSAPDSCY